MSDKPTLPARYYVLFCEWLATIGVDVERLLASARIDSKAFHAPNALLVLEQVDALVQRAIEATDRPDMGFDWGRLIKLGAHDILGYAILSSPTMDYALRLASRYWRLITPTFRMTYRRDAQQATLEFAPIMPMRPQTLQFHLEGIAVSAHEQMKALVGDRLPSYDIYLSAAQPPYHQRYRELAPARWHFEAQALPGIRMAVSIDALDHALPMADRNALQMAEARCEALLQRVTQGGGLSEWVLMMLSEAHEGMPTIEELARILHITSRTLDRRLRKEGRQFHEMTKRVRLEKAHALLGSRRMTVTQVALQLGYRDVANFTRAFRRDSGMSPSEYLARASVGVSAPASAPAAPCSKEIRATRP